MSVPPFDYNAQSTAIPIAGFPMTEEPKYAILFCRDAALCTEADGNGLGQAESGESCFG